jgi:hypothetical protein
VKDGFIVSCVLLSRDLMLASQVAQAARAAAIVLDTVAEVASLVDAAARPEVRRLIVDLNEPGVDPAELSAAVAQRRPQPIEWWAIGPHVHKARLEAARSAGWRVLTRGQFHAAASQLFREWSDAEAG